MKWTSEEIELLKKEYPNITVKELMPLLPNRTKSAIVTKLSDLQISKFHKWTTKSDNKLISLYPTHTTKEIAGILGVSVYSVENRRTKLKLSKEENKGCFKKGRVPKNKGKKQSEYMSPQGIDRSKKTRYKKGHVPHNHVPVGTIGLTTDGYYRIKTADPKTWEYLHIKIWKEHNPGVEIKNDEVIYITDGNRANLAITNLEKISRKESISRMKETNAYIAYTIEKDKIRREELLKHPEVIELQRKILKLKKKIK